jgi:HlyD family secretion protein
MVRARAPVKPSRARLQTAQRRGTGLAALPGSDEEAPMATTTIRQGEAPPPDPAPRRRTLSLWLLLAGLAVALVALALLMRGQRVTTAAVEVRDMTHTVEARGRVEGSGDVHVGTVAPGIVVAVGPLPGQRVRAGDLLFRLDDAAERAAVDQARAALEVADARLAEVDRLGAEEVARADAAIEAANRRSAELDDLAEGGLLIQPQDRSAVEQALEAATRQRDAALLRAGDDDDPARRLAAAERTQAEAALRQAELQLERRAIVAPAEGIVVERNVEPGNTVAPGADLVVISRAGGTRVVLEPQQAALDDLRRGQRAQVTAQDGGPAVRGEVLEAPEGGLFIAVPGAPASWRAGTPVLVTTETSTHEDALVVPIAALRGSATDNPWVLVTDRRKAARRDVVIGATGGGYAQITEGLERGEEVIIGSPALRPGTRVARR